MSQFNFVARLASCTQTAQKILLYALEDDTPVFAPSEGEVSFSGWTAIGADGGTYPSSSSDTTPRACYTGWAIITGLKPGKDYTCRVTQPNGNREWELTPKTLYNPGDNTKFSGFAWSCDSFGRGSDATLQYIYNNRDRARFIIKQDDVGYYDDRVIDDTSGLTGFTSAAPEITPTEFNYACAAMAYHGMFGDDGAPGDVRWKLFECLPTFETWGDHEMANNYMQSGSGVHDLTHYEKCRPVWNAFHANGMPDTLGTSVFTRDQVSPSAVRLTNQTCLHFGVECGEFAWTQMDRNSHACYDSAYIAANTGASPAPTAGLMAGGSSYASQSNDLRNFLRDSGCQFKCFSSANSIKPTNAGVDGHQEPWMDYTDTDWQAECQVFINWAVNNDSVNGTDGCLIYHRGNDHNQQVFTHTLANAGNTATVDIVEVVSGPITHNGNHTVSDQPKDTPYVDGNHSTITEWTNGAEKNVTWHQGLTELIIDGDEKLSIHQINEFGNVIWEGDIFPGDNNFVIPDQNVGSAGGSI